MGSQLFEESLHLEISLLEATYPSIESPGGYPLPFLTSTDKGERKTFGAWVLENDFLRVKIVPALGGRIWSIFDKRAAIEILPIADRIVCSSGGVRGSYLNAGIQFRLGEWDRLNSLGPVHAQAEPEGEGISTLWLGDIEACSRIGYHLALSLADNDAALSIEVRAYNRGLTSTAYRPALSAHFPGAAQTLFGAGRACAYDMKRDCGLAMLQGQEPLDSAGYEKDRLFLGRFQSEMILAPRQTDQWTVKIAPLSGLEQLAAVSPAMALGLGQELRLQCFEEQEGGGKIFLETRAKETLEAPTALSVGNKVAIPLEGALESPNAVAVRSSSGQPLLSWQRNDVSGVIPEVILPHIDWPVDLEPSQWARLCYSPSLRYLATLQRAIDAFQKKEWDEAITHFESSLLYNADDPLAWWGKALARRAAAEENSGDEENNDLLNAHFLSPLDPILRAESFLSQSQAMGKDPSPLLSGFSPDQFVEVACLLIEHGVPDQAARFLDEALRHTDSFLLRYLLAYTYLVGSRLSAEAAQQVESAGRLPDEPPFPWRPVEWKVLKRLHENFPANEALSRRFKLLDLYCAGGGVTVVS